MRKSTLFIGIAAAGILILTGLIGLYPAIYREETTRRIERGRILVGQLGLTDICLFTEATYTRHPNLADRFVAFQDHPMAFSLFPSESLLQPPAHLWEPRSGTAKGPLP